MGARRFGAVVGLALAAVATWVTTSAALGVSPLCRVRNVTQDTYGRSLIRMVEKAVDGDRLRARGKCPGEIVIDVDVSIRGVGDAVLTGRNRTRVVRVVRGATVTLRDLAVQGGAGVKFGGGISNRGFLTLKAIRVVGNAAWWRDGGGGGITNWGTLTLRDSAVRGNRAIRWGAGIDNRGRAILKRTVVAGNATTETQDDPFGGGGIVNSSSGQLRLVASRVVRNHSQDVGGAIYSFGRVTLVRSTVADNTSASLGGGIRIWEGRLIIRDSSVRGNTSGDFGGGTFSNHGSATLTDSTVSGNIAGRGAGIDNFGGSVSLIGSMVTANTAGLGGGIHNIDGTVTLDAESSVTANIPDDCVGTPAC